MRTTSLFGSAHGLIAPSTTRVRTLSALPLLPITLTLPLALLGLLLPLARLTIG